MIITKRISKTETRNKRVAAYARVSTLFDDQEESFNTQCEYYTQLIQNTPNWDFVEVYADQGKSGLSAAKSPNFMRMIEDCRKGLIDIILVRSISRFGRNCYEVQHYMHILRELNVEIKFSKENLSSKDPSTDLIFNFMAAIAEEESRSISENIKWSLLKKARQGIRHVGNNHMLGFDEIDGKLTPNKDAWIPELIFKEYAEGKKLNEIGKSLDAKGAQRMRKKDAGFTADVLLKILNNECYMGDRIIQKNPPQDLKTKRPDPNAEYEQFYVKGDHEPIVSEELWERCQKRMKQDSENRKNGIYRTNTAHYMYGKLFCGECGEVLIRRSIYYHGEYQPVWKCRDRQKGKNGNGCLNDVMSEEDLFYAICRQSGIKWKGPDEVTDKTFEKIKTVKVFKDRHLEIEYNR